MLGKKEATDDVSRLFFHLATTVLFRLFFFHWFPSRIFLLYFIKVNKPAKITLAAATAASRQMLVNEVHLHILGRQIGGRRGRSLQLPLVVARQLVPTDFFPASSSMLSGPRHKMETTRRRRRTLLQKRCSGRYKNIRPRSERIDRDGTKHGGDSPPPPPRAKCQPSATSSTIHLIFINFRTTAATTAEGPTKDM